MGVLPESESSMPRTLGRKGAAVSVALLTAISVFCVGGVALADTLQDTIADDGAGVTLVAGSPTTGSASIRVIGNNAAGDPDPGCNIDAGEASLVLTINTPTGVTASPNPLTLTSCGTNVAVTFTAASNAVSGNVTASVFSGPAGGGTYVNQVDIPITITQPVPTNTKPSVAVAGVTNGASYEIGSVPEATCDITDAEDGNSSAPAVITGTLTNGLGSQTATCDYTDDGGLSADTATATYSVVDTIAPTITYTLSPWPNGDTGWYTSEVVVDFTCEDSGSGIASCEGDTTLGDGANQSVTGTATDNAGNTATAVVSGINVDSSAPNAPIATVSPAPNANGWNRTDVVVSFASNGDSGPSGIASCSSDVPVTAETAGDVISGTCTDNAGNESAATSVTVKLDGTAPVVSEVVSVSGTAGNNGWYRSDVEVTFEANDALSGPASQTDAVSSVGEGAAIVVESPVFTDLADNSTALGAVTKSYKIDKTAPDVSLVGGPSGSYYFGSEPAAPTCDASDAVSGVSTCVISGGGSSVGPHSYTATAIDNAGNSSSVSQSYSILAWDLSGFYAPVDMGGVWNTVKGGSTVPLKFEIFAGNTEIANISAISSFTTKSVACPGATTALDEIEFVTTGGTTLRYDTAGGQFIQNWATPKKPGTCVVVTMTTDDGSTISANFKLK